MRIWRQLGLPTAEAHGSDSILPLNVARRQSINVRCARFVKAAPLLLAAALFAAAPANPQKPPITLHVETNLVQVRVRVVGRNGKPVAGLKKSDFSVKENGHPQQVSILNYIPVYTATPKVTQTSQPRSAKVSPKAPATVSRPPVWIYVDTEVAPREINQTYRAIKQFLSTQLEPGFQVSLDGLPFTHKRARLLATLGEMRQHPAGHEPKLPPLVSSTMFAEKETGYEWLELSAALYSGNAISPPPGFAQFTLRPGRAGSGALGEQMDLIEREMTFYVRAALFRYLDIIHQLELLHGQKMVVVFRSGMRMQPGNGALLRTFAAEATRRRIAFYTVDTRGLIQVHPSDNQAELIRYGVPPPALDLQTPAYYRALADFRRTRDLVMGRQAGLVDMAKVTNGQSAIDTNDLHTVFNDVVRDSSGYYLLGYYTTNPRKQGGYRPIKIAVDRQDVTVYAPKGYYAPLSYKKLSKTDKQIALWRALNYQMPGDLPVEARVNVFRDSNDRPVAIVSSGVRLGALTAKRKGKMPSVRVTALAKIKAAGAGLPVYRGAGATAPMPGAALHRAQADPTVFLSYSWKLPVAPGPHTCKVVFRDDYTGKLGADQVHFNVPDYGATPATSSLMITRNVRPIQRAAASGKTPGQPAPALGLLQAAGLNFVPQADSTFFVGNELYLLWQLYNPASYNSGAMASLALSLRTGLQRNGATLKPLNVDWKILPNAKSRMIRLAGWFNTAGLAPGDYQVVETVPLGAAHAPEKLVAGFTLLPKHP